MKVKLEIDPDASEDELIIKAKNISPEMEQLYRKLQNIEHYFLFLSMTLMSDLSKYNNNSYLTFFIFKFF